MTDEQTVRSLHARVAALTRASTTDGAEISAAGRAQFLENFRTGEHRCKLCPPLPPIDQALPADQQQRMTQARIDLHFQRMGLASAAARNRSRRLADLADGLDGELAEQLRAAE